MKKIRSWNREEDSPKLIARKKVDWSIFEFGSTIPQGFHDEFINANNGIRVKETEKKQIMLMVNQKEYSAKLVNVARKDMTSSTLQIRYDNNIDFKSLLKRVFNSSYQILEKIRAENTNNQKLIAHVPDQKAEYIEFYHTGEPFKYNLKFITDHSNTYWWVNQGQTHRSEKQGGFLWAPKQNKQGRPLKHHVDLLEAKVEDPIFTYSSGEVKTVAIVREPTISQAQPDTIANGMWEKEGYYTSVDYYDLSPPIEKAEVPEKWRIDEDGPFDRNGNVKQGYFFNITDDFATNLFHRFKERFPEEVHPYFEHKGDKVEMTDSKLVSHIDSYISSKGFYYEKEEVENLYLSLKTKPFVILSGISGTGKTKIVQWFAESVGATEENGQFTLIPVRPDWSDGSDLLGYVDIKGEFQEGPLTRVIREATNHRDKPYFVLLDEMNLARVEYYFSDILSVMESKRWENGELVTSSILPEETIGEHLGIPENLYFIGTVNMDETTHPFSKKVLDRANTIEFNRVNLNNFAFLESIDEIEKLEIQNGALSGEFLHLKDAYERNQDIVHRATDLLVEVNHILKQIGAHVGYRVRDEVCFYCIYNDQAGLMTFNQALDYQLLQKILPRLAGSDTRVLRVLEDLYTFTTGKRVSDDQLENLVESAKQATYPKSAHKLLEMIRRFRDDGFTSFWT